MKKHKKGDRLSIGLDQLDDHPLLSGIPIMEDVEGRLRRLKGKDKASGVRLRELADGVQSEWEAFKDSLVGEGGGSGQIDPVKVVPGKGRRWLVVDGRHRVHGASQLGIKSVDCVVVTSEPDTEEGRGIVKRVISASVIGRRHQTKSARAYTAVILNPGLAVVGRGRPKNKSANSADLICAKSVASEFGVSERLISYAVQLFNCPKRIRDKFEPRLWGGLGLNAILAGMEGSKKSAEVARSESNAYSCARAVKALYLNAEAALKWSDKDEAEFHRETLGFREKMSPEVCKKIIDFFNVTGDEEESES